MPRSTADSKVKPKPAAGKRHGQASFGICEMGCQRQPSKMSVIENSSMSKPTSNNVLENRLVLRIRIVIRIIEILRGDLLPPLIVQIVSRWPAEGVLLHGVVMVNLLPLRETRLARVEVGTSGCRRRCRRRCRSRGRCRCRRRRCRSRSRCLRRCRRQRRSTAAVTQNTAEDDHGCSESIKIGLGDLHIARR